MANILFHSIIDGVKYSTNSDCTVASLGDKTIITFCENDSDFDVEIKTSIFICKDEIIIEKTGPIKSNMKFAAGNSFDMVYSTPFGDIPMRITTSKLHVFISEKTILANISYSLHKEDEDFSLCEVEITVNL